VYAIWARRLADLLARSGGAVLAGVFRAAGHVRPTAKPLHPRGDLRPGVLQRLGSPQRTGSPFLDEPGRDVVVVRLSRAVGLPGGLPDIHGLAVRVPLEGQDHGDLLFASTGLGALTRFLLVPARDPRSRPLTTLLPYRTPAGGLLLAAVPGPGQRYDLLWARPRGPWRPWGRLDLEDGAGPDPVVSFDPVANPLPGLAHPGWARRLRAPAYRAARRSRS
jgi:hypothetical protein